MKINLLVLIILLTGSAHADAALPDPTRPPDFSRVQIVRQDVPKRQSEFSVNAIRISDSDRSAIVNGQIVRVGEVIGTAVVKEINLHEVILDYDRKELTLPLYSGGISKQFKTSVNED